jgi:hypothetical protein
MAKNPHADYRKQITVPKHTPKRLPVIARPNVSRESPKKSKGN